MTCALDHKVSTITKMNYKMEYHKLQLLKSTTFPSFSVTFFSSDFRSRERGFSLSSNTELSHRVIPNSYFKSSTVQKCLDLGFWLTHHKAVITWLWPAEAQVLYNPSKFQNVMIKGFHLTDFEEVSLIWQHKIPFYIISFKVRNFFNHNE